MNNANMLRGPKLLLSFANTSIEFKFVRLLRDLCWALPNALPYVTAVSELAARARGYNSLKDTLSSIGLDGHMALRIGASRLCYGLMVQSAGNTDPRREQDHLVTERAEAIYSTGSAT